MQRLKRSLVGLLVLAGATAIWLPCPHLFIRQAGLGFSPTRGLSPKAQQLAARHLQLWNDPTLRETELQRMRASNAEWDFMGRGFLVWSLANMSLRNPESKVRFICKRWTESLMKH